MRHFFDSWARLKKCLAGKHVFVFLDYDGTLAPIASAPRKARLSSSAREALSRLKDSPATSVAVISGRALEDVKAMVGIPGIVYSGNHGLELEGPKIKFKSPVSPAYRGMLARIKSDLERKLRPFKGVIIEDKDLSLAVHFRLVNKRQRPQVKTIFHEAAIRDLARGRIQLKVGKMVLELRPPKPWDKGKVVLWLLARKQFLISDRQVYPVYLGDDVTDEDAFRALKGKGLSLYVATAPYQEKRSCAEYYLRGAPEVLRFLRELAALQGQAG